LLVVRAVCWVANMDEQSSNAPEDEVCDEGSHGQNFFASVVLTQTLST
jgi:hypothetical protein